ncbi:MAG: S9 family peptidase [Acidobacteria bacterium]|nr:MAG: S9 family peptidase [Acidobacteriota bacterium]
MTRRSTCWLLASIFLAASSAAQETASKGRLTADHILDWERVSDPQISPDGKRTVYTRSMVNRIDDRWDSELWMVGTDGTRNRFLVDGSSPRWSPDGTRLAYLSDGKPKGKQILVRWMDAEGATSQVTHVTTTPRDLHWSPDGTRIAFTMIVPAKETWDLPSMPSPPEGADWTKTPRIVRTMHFRQDRVGFLEEGYRHLFLVPADGGSPRQLTEGKWHVGSRGSVGLDYGAGIDWTPDGKTLVFDGAMEDDADVKYRESHIYRVDIASGDITAITSKRGPWTSPVVSPDGKTVAFSGYDWTAQTYRVSDLYVVNIDGTAMRNISSELDRDVRGLVWSSDGSAVYFMADDRGARNVHSASLNGGLKQLTDGEHMLTLGSVAANGTAVAIRSSFHVPPDVVAFSMLRPSEMKRLTHVNDDVLAGVELGEVEEIWYESSTEDAARIQGWIVKPPGFDSSKRYPMILQIHGGPHGMYNVGFNNAFQNYAANDYVLLYTNPRGSTGYGTEFGNAIDNGYPSVDHEDLMAGVDHVLEKGYVDADRLYVTGCSGGGVLSSWAIGQTDRFAAAAVRCPVVNWMSFAGTADITLWAYYRFEGFPWDNAEKYLEHSPLMYVGNVTTPTLLMTGELDLRTPMSQTEEYYQALKILGVETALLRFNKEYHGTSSMPSNFIRTQLYILDWFGEHRKGMSVSTEP